MSDPAESKYPLDQFAEAETDEEFGVPVFKEHFADILTPAVLRDWTAKDFASIYVRFRPHLDRHARRFLENASQVEEVVQDAFLYLMTTLPELDSELGVLKFLKWKVRLLALDVIRANRRATLTPIDEHQETLSLEGELSEGLERADDAAIVALALAKLQPRQREALIATLYEEKDNEAVARQMGLSDNAFRQLLFRARASFKKAFVGEAETANKTAGEILSIAAKRAGQQRSSGSWRAGGVASVLVLGVSAFLFADGGYREEPILESSLLASQRPQSETVAPGANSSEIPRGAAELSTPIVSNPGVDTRIEGEESEQDSEVRVLVRTGASPNPSDADSDSDDPAGSIEPTVSQVATEFLTELSDHNRTLGGEYLANSQVLTLEFAPTLTGFLGFSADQSLHYLSFRMTTPEGKSLFLVPTDVHVMSPEVQLPDDFLAVDVVAAGIIVSDEASGQLIPAPHLQEAGIRITCSIDANHGVDCVSTFLARSA